MTLRELENSLPNGFHDSFLSSFSIDYVQRTLQMNMSVCVGLPDDPRETQNDVRDAQIDFTGLVFFVADRPATESPFQTPGELTIVDGYETRSITGEIQIDRKLLDAIPGDAFAHSFYVHEWISFIHIAAKGCAMKWTGDRRAYRDVTRAFFTQ
jgi:hypothetical protein